jgi:hypothetical protein
VLLHAVINGGVIQSVKSANDIQRLVSSDAGAKNRALSGCDKRAFPASSFQVRQKEPRSERNLHRDYAAGSGSPKTLCPSDFRNQPAALQVVRLLFHLSRIGIWFRLGWNHDNGPGHNNRQTEALSLFPGYLV